jgi:PAS domain S-box-containing protein
MKDPSRTNQELLEENALLKQRIKELEQSESERKRAEEALKESTEALIRIQKAVESSSDAISMSNPQGSHFYQNKAFLELFEYSVEELNKPLAPIVTYADPEVGREVFETIMQGNPWVGETIMVAKSRRRFPVFLRADAVKDENGNIIGLISIHTDVTERKFAEEKVNNQTGFISALLDTIPSPIFYKDISGKYLGCNRAYEEIIGKSREEVVGKDIYDLYPPETANLYAEKDRELYEHPGSQIYDGKFNAADGKVRDVIINKATYTDTSNNVAGLVGIFIDITERKLAQQRLSEEVSLKNFLLDLFKKAPTLGDKDLYDCVLDCVVRVTGSTIGFFHLVSDDQKNVILTAWNKEALENCTAAYATHYPLEQAGNWVDCVRLRRPVVYNEFPISPNRKGLPEGHTPVKRFMSVPVVEGDKVRIIFGVGNKYEEYNELDAGRIQVVANDLQLIMAQRQAEEALKEESRRLQQALDEVRTLRGIVPICANCKKIRDDKGFWNQVEKYVSERTEAEFSHGICPDCAKKLYPELYEEKKIKDMERLVILLVDDEEDFRMIFIRQIKRILKDHEFEFIEASDGEEALELLKGEVKPSIIILDYAMPKINGVELLRRIDSDHNDLYDVPRIMISGYSQKEIISEAQRLRCVFFEKNMDNIFYQQICQYMTNTLVDLAHKKRGVNK